MDSVAEIKKLYELYWKLMIERDTEGLREIMTEDYHLYHMTGLMQSREEFLDQLAGGTFNYYSAVHDRIDVEVISDTEAEMQGFSRVEAAVYGGSRNTWRLSGDFTLRREEGVWKLSSSRASTY